MRACTASRRKQYRRTAPLTWAIVAISNYILYGFKRISLSYTRSIYCASIL